MMTIYSGEMAMNNFSVVGMCLYCHNGNRALFEKADQNTFKCFKIKILQMRQIDRKVSTKAIKSDAEERQTIRDRLSLCMLPLLDVQNIHLGYQTSQPMKWLKCVS